MDTKVRKLLMCHRMYHPTGDVESLYIKRENGGRVIIHQVLTYKTTSIRFDTTIDSML